jgi:hypothetical protein
MCRTARAVALTKEAFYGGDPRRKGSRERDLGMAWHERGATVRLTYVLDTAELVAVTNDTVYEVLARLPWEQVEHRLNGWEAVHNRHDIDSFSWVRALVAN